MIKVQEFWQEGKVEFCQIFPLASRRGSARTWSWLILVLLLTVAALQSGQAQDFQVLYSFTGGPDGAGPTTGLTLDHNGNLYGTAQGGGQGFGTVFKLTRHNSSWLFSPLYNFHNNDGAFPNTPLVIGPDGALYGTTQRGGLTTLGTVYVLRPPLHGYCEHVSCSWNETVLYNFRAGSDSAFPRGTIAFDTAGNLYGAASGDYPDDGGNVWKLTGSHGIWTFSVIHQFTGAQGDGDGSNPFGGIIFYGPKIYGTTGAGGACNGGAVFQLTPSGSGWTEQTIASFCAQGGYPYAGVVADGSGKLYGATRLVDYAYEVIPSGGGWTYTTIYQLSNSTGPWTSLTIDAQGNLYGTVPTDGQYPLGYVFKLSNSNGVWTLTHLHDFTGGHDGASPYGGVILDADGNIYGTAAGDGAHNEGVIWKITP